MNKSKRILLLVIPVIAGITLVSVNTESKGVYQAFNTVAFHKLQSGGASAGNTGAPGEGSCVGCHGNSASGAGFNILEWADGVNNYTPGETYSIQLSMNDASSKNGFQLVALTASGNAQAGVMTATDETRTQRLVGQAGRQYIGHRAAGTSVSQWTFDWTAPTTNVGNVIFYVATNKSNAANNSSGDLIRLSQHVFPAPEAELSLTAYEKIQSSLSIGYNRDLFKISILFVSDESEPLHVNIMNAQGQSVQAHALGMSYPGENNKEVRLSKDLSTGIYFVNLFVGNKAYSQKILVD
jgi:hypothetical protein